MKMRLAMRVEGTYWNAYVAEEGTMTSAVLLGSIAMAAVHDKERKQRFMDLMQDSMADQMKALGADIQGWNAPVRALETERAGHA